MYLKETSDDDFTTTLSPPEYMEWFIAKEIADVVLQLSPHYIRRKLNEPPLRDSVKWNTSDPHILRVISSFNPVANAPKKIGLLSRQTTMELVKLMERSRSLASQFLIAIGEKVLCGLCCLISVSSISLTTQVLSFNFILSLSIFIILLNQEIRDNLH